MFLMASGGFGMAALAKAFPESFWAQAAPQFDHVAWVGCVLWDLIQPAFMFMVGAAAAYSTARRLQQGDSLGQVMRHAAIRALVLILLGVMLASNVAREKQTVWLFTNVLAQIGLGYFPLVLLLRLHLRWQMVAFWAIVVLYGVLFAIWPTGALPSQIDRAWAENAEWQTGFFAHWNPHVNMAADFDRWFLNLFPRKEVYYATRGGYQTLNFVPSLATMLLGLMAGELLRREGKAGQKLRILVAAGLGLLAAGWIAGQSVCPLVKRIWTPSWVLFSGGWVILMLALSYLVIDMQGWKAWSIPFAVLGMNSIFVYLGYQLWSGWIRNALAQHLGPALFTGPYGTMMQRVGVLVVLWLLAWWLYRQKVFLRI